MKSFGALTVLSLLAGLVSAKPVAVDFQKKIVNPSAHPAGARNELTRDNILGDPALERALKKRYPSSNGYLADIGARDLSGDVLLKRSGNYFSVDLSNQVVAYYVSLDIGTPAQSIDTVLDTGSSDLWVMGSDNSMCSSTTSSSSASGSSGTIACSAVTKFYPSNSTTFNYNSSKAFIVYYGGSTFAEGTMGYDDITFGNTVIKNANFGVANATNSTVAVFGIGFQGLEATNFIQTYDSSLRGYSYSNVPMKLKEQGIIESIAYSLYLDDLNANTGTILFGGVDHDKYSGDLVTVPMVADPSTYSTTDVIAMFVELTKITWTNGNTSTLGEGSLPALLDSGTSFTYLPTDIFDDFMTVLGASYSSALGYYVTSCSVNSTVSHLTFHFNEAAIQVPVSELIYESSSGVEFSEPQCAVLMYPSSSTIILGDSFLRSAYVVYDLENKEISLAQAAYNVDSSNIDQIVSSVPSATADPSASFMTSFTGFASVAFTASYSKDTTTHVGAAAVLSPSRGASLASVVTGLVSAVFYML